jgi:O-antigen/teichoic acid export membrane protein
MLIGRFALAFILAAGLGVASTFAPRADALVLALYGLTLLPAGANARWAHYGLHNGAVVARSRIAAELMRVLFVFALVRGADDALFVPLAQLAGDTLAAVWMISRLRRGGIHLSFVFDRSVFVSVVKRAAPLLANNMLALAIYNADVIFLRFFRSVVEVGQYLAAYTLINFLGVLGNLATVTLLPNLASLRGAPDEQERLVHTALARVFVAGLPMAVGGALVATRMIDFVFGAEYLPAGNVLAILICTIPPLLARGVYSAVLISADRHDAVLRSTGAAAALNVALNFLMIPLLGMTGAAITTLLAELVRLLLTRSWALRSGLASAPLARYTRVMISTIVMAAAIMATPGMPLPLAVIGGILVYFTTLSAVGGIGWEDGRPLLRV